MAIYKQPTFIKRSSEPAFDEEHPPEGMAEYSGIYRCPGCGREILCYEGNPLPPATHHAHSANEGVIRWQLAIFAESRPNKA
jgi:hypothetical protein